MRWFRFNVELPAGQKGRSNAHDVAANVLEAIIGSVSKEVDKYDSILKSATAARRRSGAPRVRGGMVVGTPHASRRKTNGGETPRTPAGATTPKTEHKRRKSIGLLSPVPPSLKKTVTPSKSRAYTLASTDSPEEGGSKRPRPILR